MTLTSLLASASAAGLPWLAIVDAVGKASILLGAAGLTSLALRRGSASARHLVWTLALVGALIVPALSLALPRWRVPVVSIAASESLAPSAASAPTEAAPALARRAPHRTASSPARRANEPAASQALPGLSLSGVSWQVAVMWIWAAGFISILARLVVGLIGVQWMSRRTEVVTDAPWLPLARRLAGDLGVTPRVAFLRSPRATMPMAWGIVKPAVLMPADADEWPVERLRIVLLHELAHVSRRDCLTHLLAQAACAVYWFHPLAWMAARRARNERERACDDLVLAAGTRGSDYAEELLEIARVMRAGRFPAVLAGATLAMAHRSQLEGRLLAILDPRIPRRGLTRVRALATTIACALAIVPLAALQPWTSEPATQVPAQHAADAAVPSPSALQPPTVATPAPRRDPPPPQRSGPPAGSVAARAEAEADVDVAGIVADVVQQVPVIAQAVVDGVAEGLALSAQGGTPTPRPTPMPTPTPNPNPNPNPNPIRAGNGGEARKADPRTIAALTAALKDTDKEVRETAMHALVQLRDPSIYEPLVAALRDASPDVREQAAFGLGQLRDRRAVDPLMASLKDSSGSVREQAVFALGQLRDPRAVDGLIAALKDSAPDVREQAAFSLGQIRDKRATPALAAAIADGTDDVREQAVFALGQLRDPAAVDALVTALRDTRPSVREQAAFSLGQIRDRKATDALIAALKDAASDVRRQAAFALGQIRDQGAVEALVFALKDADAEVREQAAFALGQLRDPRAIDGLTAALKDASSSVRQQAAFALGQLAR